jgi:hypothetical protein
MTQLLVSETERAVARKSKPATLDDLEELIALVRETKGIDSLVADLQVRSELGGISNMTWWRWQTDKALIALGLPPPVKVRDRIFRFRKQLEHFKNNLMLQAIKDRSRLLKRGPKPRESSWVRARNGRAPQRVDAGEARKVDALGKTRKPSSRSSHPNQYAISDGRDAVGTVREIDGVFTAITTNGTAIGEFNTLLEAARAFDEGQKEHKGRLGMAGRSGGGSAAQRQGCQGGNEADRTRGARSSRLCRED